MISAMEILSLLGSSWLAKVLDFPWVAPLAGEGKIGRQKPDEGLLGQRGFRFATKFTVRIFRFKHCIFLQV